MTEQDQAQAVVDGLDSRPRCQFPAPNFAGMAGMICGGYLELKLDANGDEYRPAIYKCSSCGRLITLSSRRWR